ncbi:hypothetical protein [Chitinophaga sancti]|uniref:Uncharacterized protein n=1 Tax=Chitinophaga sancti TaxID=1004 RepID=A0ABZ0XKR2_9BACT|nr:hypothetical protein [Chitinophaga sancti]WQD63144.1 hypothetical protein U0033_01960 [Chitinophaga sancti]WQG91231.1 hypothetical protein SR876_06955 [Chitinophaga sancti]
MKRNNYKPGVKGKKDHKKMTKESRNERMITWGIAISFLLFFLFYGYIHYKHLRQMDDRNTSLHH